MARSRGGLRARQARRGPAARGHPRDRARRTGNWPVRGWFTAEGLAREVARALALEPREPADEPRREHRRRCPRTTTSTSRCSALLAARARGHARSTSLDVAKLWLDYLPPGRIFTAERVAARNLLEAYLPPETATRRNPFREWIGARLRVDAYGWAAGGDAVARRADGVGGRARQPHRERRLRRDVHGRGARPLADGDSPAACADAGLSVVPPRAGSREALADGARPGDGRDWEARRRRAATTRYGELHWVHAINNTALVAAALYAFDGDFSGAICGVVQGGLGHRYERRGGRLDPRRDGGTAGIEERWTAPLDGRFASSLPGFDAITSTSSSGGRSPSSRRSPTHDDRRRAPRDPLVPRPLDLPDAARPGRAARGARRREDRGGAGRPGRLAGVARARSRAGATRRARADRLRRRRLRRARARLDADAASPSRSSGSGTSCSTTTRPAASRPTASSPRPSASSAASTASCSGTPTR